MRTLLLVLALALAACAGILGRRAEPARPFEHRKHAVAGVGCLECHAGVTNAGDEGPLHLPETTACTRCHERPHDARPCGGCHGEAHIRAGAELARRHLRFDHKTHLASVRGQCVPCHVAAGSRDPTSMRPPMAACFGCHHHSDQWRVRDCEGCHVDLPAERATPASHAVHEGDFLREHGVRAAAARDLCATCHSESSCAACHGVSVPTLPWRLAFDRPSLARLHPAGFLARHADESRVSPGLCATCHGENFCTTCHTERRVAPGSAARSPHPPGWVRARGGEHGRAARLDPQGCASCHGGAGEALCVGCHRVGGPGGNPHGPAFSSALDKLRDEPCRQCHAP